MTQADPDYLTTATPRCRPFKLVDAMILTAAAAVWMGLMRPQWNQFKMVGMASRKGIPWQGIEGIGRSVGVGLLVSTAATYPLSLWYVA